MKFGRQALLGALCLCVALAAGLLALLGERKLAASGELRALKADAARLVEQVEMAIDHAITELTTLRELSIMNCDATALLASRDMLLSRATFKDIAVFAGDGTLRCRANVANLSDRTTPVVEAEAGGFSFGLPQDMPEGLLSVRWPSGPSGSLAAVIGLDPFLFSFFSASFRDTSSVAVMLKGGHLLASFGDPRSIGSLGSIETVEHSSSRYPIAVSITVPKTVLHGVAAQKAGVIAWIAGVLSGLATAFAIWCCTRPPNPVAALKAAIALGEIRPYFQPIMATRGNVLTGCEVLARWVKPDGTVIGPDHFIPLAESSGLICEMTERLLRDSVSALGEITGTHQGFKLAVNLSPAHFMKEGFADSIVRLCRETGLPTTSLVIELTERQNISDFAKAAAIAEHLRAVGIRLSIDDVGTGHNGLSTLQDMPGDIVKIDKRFVETALDNPLSAAIIDMLVSLARRLDRSTVAEGVETEGQALAMAKHGVDELQGYVFSKPLAAKAFLAWCAARAAVAHDRQPDGKPLDAAA
jgi:sensor c-di-GMP phosphodiesterase-like protein